jgi:hypothetical protein
MKSVNFLVLSIAQLATVGLYATPHSTMVQADTVLVNETSTVPVFDGIGNDACWQDADWQTIDQVWIPWGTIMDPSDFSGKYKVLWSASENLLYFLLEITDDVVSDAYTPGESADIYNFDMFEVFIDENKSGGYHVFDGTANNEASLGVNAENAFAYHIFTRFPESGATNDSFRVEDLGGTDWAHVINEIYNSHFPNFILRKEGNINTWEFSLIVYDDTYSPENIENSRVTLTDGKVMGLTIAYNDDDEPEVDPALTERDNFIGSVAVSQAAYNDHWKNADDFGPAKLVSDIVPVESYMDDNTLIDVFPNPSDNDFTVQVINSYIGNVKIRLYNFQGKELLNTTKQKLSLDFREKFTLNVKSGLYKVELSIGGNRYYRSLSYIQ